MNCLINGINNIYSCKENIETLGDYGKNLTIILDLEKKKDIKSVLNSIKNNLIGFEGQIIICTSDNTIKSMENNTQMCIDKEKIQLKIKTRWFIIINRITELQFNFIPKCNEFIKENNSHFINLPSNDNNMKMAYVNYFIDTKKGAIYSKINEVYEGEYFSDNFSNKNELNSPFCLIDKNFIENIKYHEIFDHYKLNYLIYKNNYKCYTLKAICFKIIVKKSDLESKLQEKLYDFFETPKEHNNKPKLALVVDVEGWAFWNIASQIEKNLKDFFNIEIITRSSIDELVSLIFYLKKFDLVHFFWRGELLCLNQESTYNYLDKIGINSKYFFDNYINKMYFTTSVYDHLFLSDSEKDKVNSILNYTKNYTVSSKKLHDIYKKNHYDKEPAALITDGVDLDMFYPQNLKRFTNPKDELIIGWVGNSAWNNKQEDIKGVNTILKPAINNLQKKGYKIKEFFADRQVRMITHNQMKNYYSKIDVLVCSSKIEGTPNPILEAMACGVPCISTNVGIVPEVFGEKQKKYILEKRSMECLEKAIIHLYENRNILKELSEENLENIKNWTWKNKTQQFKEFFELCLKEKNNEK